MLSYFSESSIASPKGSSSGYSSTSAKSTQTIPSDDSDVRTRVEFTNSSLLDDTQTVFHLTPSELEKENIDLRKKVSDYEDKFAAFETKITDYEIKFRAQESALEKVQSDVDGYKQRLDGPLGLVALSESTLASLLRKSLKNYNLDIYCIFKTNYILLFVGRDDLSRDYMFGIARDIDIELERRKQLQLQLQDATSSF